jgi:hypothetical protein
MQVNRRKLGALLCVLLATAAVAGGATASHASKTPGVSKHQIVIGGTLVASPGIYWWENRKIAKALATRGLPRANAPGQFPIAKPATGCFEGTVLGRTVADEGGEVRATGPCCDQPDWIEAYRVKDEDHVPCHACGHGVMAVTDHAIH